jgi:hypothetical protein
VKPASRKAVSASEQRRNNLQFERERARVLRELYPAIGSVRVGLVFGDGAPRMPSPQSHTFYPAASAFFRFACPCAECDGDFDLGPVVGSLLADVASAPPASARQVTGRKTCDGVRLRDRAGGHPCLMSLEYQLAACAAG